ncbi:MULTISPECIES: DegV family protein [unclassified Bacillus (in: firmicutes)]|uniref:DegV family protein n=1 Tax=unclassified Bacillus (in: firmicutes) TaxID=185979 RepID=UPI0008E4C70F|nr:MULTISPECIES: DegV family protein [unclassified Bacillus (in: firmicutes)]SFA88638.1 EDD domain protein, DegV family [Bacillus sp. UNCCL13]SFQ84659.1 EDD domain protein, DegV family [Bacillus sp. cl95]
MLKKKIAWITDSTAYVTEELKNNPDVYVMPLEIIFGSEAFEDGIDLSTDELYSRIRKEKEIPKTSQPASGKFLNLFEKLKQEYEGAIAIHVSSKLSGTLSSCKTGAEMAEFKLETVDSKSMSYAITTLLNKGIELANEGNELEGIAEYLRKEADRSQNYILLGNLEQFYKGGRMSGTQFLLGSILKIKPVIRIHQGEFELYEKVRSEKKAFNRLVELFDEAYQKNEVKEIQIMHGNVIDKAKEMEALFKTAYPEIKVVIGEISSTIAVHAGEGTLAIIWHNL